MAKPQLGTKRTCQHCGARFYDLNKQPAACPKCGFENDFTRTGPTPRSAPPPVQQAPPQPALEDPAVLEKVEEIKVDPALPADEELEDEIDEIPDEAVIEDTSDIGEDDDELSEVMEHIDEDVQDKG